MDSELIISNAEQSNQFSRITSSTAGNNLDRVWVDRGTIKPMDEREFLAAVRNLGKKLASDNPPRLDAPRGYYLNIRI